jgi:hypothetical protein
MRRLLVIVCLVLVGSLSFAQSDTPESEPSPLMQALSAVPDNATVRESAILFSFGDYHAAIAAAGFEIPQDWASFIDNDPFSPRVLPPAGAANLLQYLFLGAPAYPEILGFDFFQIGQALEFGTLPGMGQVLVGSIDPVAVVTAFTARDYTAEEQELGFLLCPANGCDSGQDFDINNRMPENPFGGNLGRREISYVQDGIFVNSPDDVTLLSMTYALKGSARSLAESPELQAADHALSEWPYVSAVIAVSPLELGVGDPMRMIEGQEVVIPEGADVLLPFYSAALFASVADEERQYGLALLVYADAETAEIAAAAVNARLGLLSSVTEEPYRELFAEFGEVVPAEIVTDEATGLSVVVLRVGGPTHDEAAENGLVHSSFNRLVQSIYRRDTEWLRWGVEGE